MLRGHVERHTVERHRTVPEERPREEGGHPPADRRRGGRHPGPGGGPAPAPGGAALSSPLGPHPPLRRALRARDGLPAAGERPGRRPAPLLRPRLRRQPVAGRRPRSWPPASASTCPTSPAGAGRGRSPAPTIRTAISSSWRISSPAWCGRRRCWWRPACRRPTPCRRRWTTPHRVRALALVSPLGLGETADDRRSPGLHRACRRPAGRRRAHPRPADRPRRAGAPPPARGLRRSRAGGRGPAGAPLPGEPHRPGPRRARRLPARRSLARRLRGARPPERPRLARLGPAGEEPPGRSGRPLAPPPARRPSSTSSKAPAPSPTRKPRRCSAAPWSGSWRARTDRTSTDRTDSKIRGWPCSPQTGYAEAAYHSPVAPGRHTPRKNFL